MINFCLIVVLACCLSTAHSGQFFATKHNGDDLAALCAGKTTSLIDLSQLASLVNQLKVEEASQECPGRTVDALRDLQDIVTKNKGNECSMGAYDEYKAFYVKYLDRSNKDEKKKSTKLPKSLRDFALAYGVQLSDRCRINMVTNLRDGYDRLLKADDFEAVKELVEQDGFFADILIGNDKKPDILVLLSEIDTLGKKNGKEGIEGSEENEQTKPKVPFNFKTVSQIKKIQERCDLRFKPVYEPLMLPVTRLANLGFQYRSAELEKLIKEPSVSKSVGWWSRVAFLCDVFGQIKLVEDKEAEEKSEGNDVTQVFVLSNSDEDKAQTIKGKNLLDVAEVSNHGIEPLNSEPALSSAIPDEILPVNLKSAVDKINTSRNELANIKKRHWKLMMSRLWHLVKHGDAHFSFSQLLKKVIMANKNDQDVSTQLVKSLNDLVDRDTNPDKPVAVFVEPITVIGFSGIVLGLIALVILAVRYMYGADKPEKRMKE